MTTEEIYRNRAKTLLQELKEAQSEYNKTLATVGIGAAKNVLHNIHCTYKVPDKQKELQRIRIFFADKEEFEHVNI